jgi:predicted kinase
MTRMIVLTKGLPGSGKTTWCKAQLADPSNRFKHITKDALREMLDGSVWSRENEKFVLKARDFLVEEALKAGYDVLVDDTNLHPKHLKRMTEIAKKHGALVDEKDFTHVTVEECIKRDLGRPNSVGEKVIRSMWKKFLFVPADVVPPPARVAGDAPRAIIVDIDGTVARMVARGPHDYAKVSTDAPKEQVIAVIGMWADATRGQHRQVIFCSGRPDSCRADTERWLKENVLSKVGIISSEWHLLMRPTWLAGSEGKAKDQRPDFVIKKELYDAKIKGGYNVDFALDDRNQTVEVWRREGILCMQVAPGEF